MTDYPHTNRQCSCAAEPNAKDESTCLTVVLSKSLGIPATVYLYRVASIAWNQAVQHMRYNFDPL